MVAKSVGVSVVVATFNSGSYLDRLVDSLDRQSLPAEQFEVVFVDDGSTDGTDHRLRDIAAARPNVRATRIAHSGWPGKPRNVGLDMAKGDYVFFADHDDFFGDEALERMLNYVAEQGSDILLPREVRVDQRSPGRGPFTTNLPRVDLTWRPLFTSLTPHKLFRRDFLRKHDIRFPEGRRRLEDHAFVVPAIFAAHVISVLADYPCYYWVYGRGIATNNSRGIDPETYYPFLTEILDIVDANTPPGALRDRLLTRWYRGKVLAVIERKIEFVSPAERESLISITGALARDRFAGCDPYLNLPHRALSALVRAGDTATILGFRKALNGVTARPRLRSTVWRGDVLHIAIDAALEYGDGRPVRFRRAGRNVAWVPPVDLGNQVDESMLDVTKALRSARVRATVRHADLGVHHALDGVGETKLRQEPDGLGLTATLSAGLDVRTLAHGRALGSGRWQVRLVTDGVGLKAFDPVPVAIALPGLHLVDGISVQPYAAKSGNLCVAVSPAGSALASDSKPRRLDGTQRRRIPSGGARVRFLHSGRLRSLGRHVPGLRKTALRVRRWLRPRDA